MHQVQLFFNFMKTFFQSYLKIERIIKLDLYFKPIKYIYLDRMMLFFSHQAALQSKTYIIVSNDMITVNPIVSLFNS